MNKEFEAQFEALVEKMSELLTGDSSPDMVAKVKVWAMYNHIHKSMPALAGHWNQTHPEAKAQMRSIFEEIKSLNQALLANKEKQE
jgi:hypothetical protein